jgi:hypothetical protein
MKLHIEHIADDEPENPQPYWHIQDRIISELGISVARGIRPGLGFNAQIPLRLVRERVRYEDLARQPYTPPVPGLHHRNETLTGLGDPQVGLDFGNSWHEWTLAGRLAISIPIGLTQPNPFELGRLGLWHEHIQFGTGTWDPILGLGVGRTVGPLNLQLSGNARLTQGENEHGYHAGNRYNIVLAGSPDLGSVWSASAGLTLAREEAEKWTGHIEGEGNLGRTDLFMGLGAGRAIPHVGAISLNLQFPLSSESTGEQSKIPLIASLSLTR